MRESYKNVRYVDIARPACAEQWVRGCGDSMVQLPHMGFIAHVGL